ncbi:apolipoprotein C-II [Caloenas nicobarica]|uniref:apolipoprotein C-II n=1 Tax=Caloenas nicobarica TaxID=187106 RepID=UPI0032B710D6
MAGGPPKTRVVAALLLLLIWDAAGAAPSAPPPPGRPSPLWGYLGGVGEVTRELWGRLSVPGAPQRLRDAYDRGTSAVLTYTGILSDQLYHWWQGEQ